MEIAHPPSALQTSSLAELSHSSISSNLDTNNGFISPSSDLGNSDHYDSVHQFEYNDSEQTGCHIEEGSYTDSLNNQDHSQALWAHHFNQCVSSHHSYDGQRVGHTPTADDLSKALDLEHQAQQQEKEYKSSTEWAQFFEQEHNPHNAHINHENAAEHKREAEELQAEADKLRNQT